jgi:hypothetical protein
MDQTNAASHDDIQGFHFSSDFFSSPLCYHIGIIDIRLWQNDGKLVSAVTKGLVSAPDGVPNNFAYVS